MLIPWALEAGGAFHTGGTAKSSYRAQKNSRSPEGKAADMQSADSILSKLRTICRRLPGATETVTFGHPTFQVGGKTFAVLETYKGELGIALKVGKLMQGVFLDDARFFLTPYAGKHGWVTLRAYAAPLDWEEIGGLLDGSYRLVLEKRSPRANESARSGRREERKRGSD